MRREASQRRTKHDLANIFGHHVILSYRLPMAHALDPRQLPLPMEIVYCAKKKPRRSCPVSLKAKRQLTLFPAYEQTVISTT
ncbi:MAG: hypothetical protein VX589_03650 [Myxococcota bacterium]|nr:hypothetical protein [Myxococcota bacterium]